MDAWRVEPVHGGAADLPAEIKRFGAAGLSLRLASLQQKLERDFPITVILDVRDRAAADGLPPDLTEATHCLLHAAARDAAHACASLVMLAVRIDASGATLRVEHDGAGFAFKGAYDADDLLAFGVGPQTLARRSIACGGRLRFEPRARGGRIEIRLPRKAASTPASTLVKAG